MRCDIHNIPSAPYFRPAPAGPPRPPDRAGARPVRGTRRNSPPNSISRGRRAVRRPSPEVGDVAARRARQPRRGLRPPWLEDARRLRPVLGDGDKKKLAGAG